MAGVKKPTLKRLPPPKEQVLVKSVLQWLRFRGWFAWRQNQGVAMLPGRGGRLQPVRFAGVPGISDVIGVAPDGRFVAIECKRRPRKPTPDQLDFLAKIAASGGIAGVVYDLADLDRILREAAAQKGAVDDRSRGTE
jgi:hypothetical protein